MAKLTYRQPNKDQIDCLSDGKWCALIQKLNRGRWELTVVEIRGQRQDQTRGIALGTGEHFDAGPLQEAKSVLSDLLNAA
ncbi:hypothetical protein [Marinobacter sp. ELB17]|uniref:hypothetical protein n=1 Tax=Marinobacter sp. ELB17 TaxID=270374 RepID=UPI0000F39C67|nr:hypothetical protein [Marinobacter sp. ELB17]EAZ97227.1 hypothetical protein MELB17_10058 [Marinobacter sp. ELB17]